MMLAEDPLVLTGPAVPFQPDPPGTYRYMKGAYKIGPLASLPALPQMSRPGLVRPPGFYLPGKSRATPGPVMMRIKDYRSAREWTTSTDLFAAPLPRPPTVKHQLTNAWKTTAPTKYRWVKGKGMVASFQPVDARPSMEQDSCWFYPPPMKTVPKSF